MNTSLSLREALLETRRPCPFCAGTGKIYKELATMGLLRSQRRLKGLTAKGVAASLGISPQYLSDLEMGRRRVSCAIVEQYLAILEETP